MILGKTPPEKLPLDGRQPQNFSEWLEVATWNLVPSAQARVRPEIEAHYAEAVQAHLAADVGDSAAQAAALADLGEAKAAAKRFSQQYLTTLEVKTLGKQIFNARSTELTIPRMAVLFCSFMMSVLSLIGWIFGLQTNVRHFYFFTAPLLMAYLAITSLDLVAIVLARRRPTTTLARHFSSIGTSKRLAVQFGAVALSIDMLIGNGPERLFGDSFYFLMQLVFAILIVANLVGAVGENRKDSLLRKKLAAASEDDLPPSDPSTA
jgi:hypothetical protein